MYQKHIWNSEAGASNSLENVDKNVSAVLHALFTLAVWNITTNNSFHWDYQNILNWIFKISRKTQINVFSVLYT